MTGPQQPPRRAAPSPSDPSPPGPVPPGLVGPPGGTAVPPPPAPPPPAAGGYADVGGVPVGELVGNVTRSLSTLMRQSWPSPGPS